MTPDSQADSAAKRKTWDLSAFAPAILDSLDAGLLIVDRDRTILYRNKVAKAMLIHGNDLDTAFRNARFLDKFPGWEQAVGTVLDRKDEVRIPCAIPTMEKAGPKLVLLRCMPLVDRGHGQSCAVITLTQAESPPALSQDHLEVSQRLVSLGRLAARVAHELNNPLDGILRYVNLAIRLAGDEASEPKLNTYLSESRTGLLRMVRIIGDLLEFSRTTDGEFDEMNVNEVVEQAVRNVTSTADMSRIVVTVDLQNHDAPVLRSSRLYQVCCNLIKNAIDAMPDGGRLSLTTGVVEGTVIIRVADTGVGLPPDADRVFEPFFTTKEPGKGTGLGLAICRDFVEDMHGTIEASPGEDGGAVFTIQVPVETRHRPSRLTGSTPEGHLGL